MIRTYEVECRLFVVLIISGDTLNLNWFRGPSRPVSVVHFNISWRFFAQMNYFFSFLYRSEDVLRYLSRVHVRIVLNCDICVFLIGENLIFVSNDHVFNLHNTQIDWTRSRDV